MGISSHTRVVPGQHIPRFHLLFETRHQEKAVYKCALGALRFLEAGGEVAPGINFHKAASLLSAAKEAAAERACESAAEGLLSAEICRPFR